MGEPFVPTIFVERNRARDVIVVELVHGARVDPERVVAPASGGCDLNELRFGNPGLPGDFAAKIESLHESRQ